MSVRTYLSSIPLQIADEPALNDIVHCDSHEAMAATAFVGSLRKHPYDEAKCLLLETAEGDFDRRREASIIEFRICDIVGIDSLAMPVDEGGVALSMATVWVRRGSIAVRFEPFEVNGETSNDIPPTKLRDYLYRASMSRDARL